jgi:hypothetical protein
LESFETGIDFCRQQTLKRSYLMTLAQVVYEISTNEDFATKWHSDPDSALAQKGLTLSKEEKEFLRMGLSHSSAGNRRKVDFAQVGTSWGGWA